MYAIARAYMPMMSLDIGTRWGSSALQIALNKPATTGRCISIDVERFIHGSKTKVGKFIPPELDVQLETSDIVVYLKMDTKSYDLIYEDSEHTFEMTKDIYELAIDRLVPGGVIISHDATHPKFRGAVVKGIQACGIEPEVYLVEGDSCGLAIWRKPSKPETIASYKWDNETKIMDDIHEEKVQAEDNTEAPQEKPKRKRRKKAPKRVKETAL